MSDDRSPDHEVVVIGAGVAGIYQIYRLSELGVDAIVLDAAPDVGGTWYWNRYPGCRFDSESYSYGYSFSRELLDEWDWSEHFSGQPENLRYLNYVVDKFDLRRYMRFNAVVAGMAWDDANRMWEVRLADGRTVTCRFVVTAMGPLSVPTTPRYEGMDEFEGLAFHTFYWPHDPLDLAGKRVAVIGTGATGIQIISAIAGTVAQLTVFQRRPNWSAPLHNRAISSEEMADIRSRYDEIFDMCARAPSGFPHELDQRSFYSLTPEERVAFWDELYEMSGFSIWLRNFKEILTDEEANAEFSEYIADRIRRRVHDPETAEKLIPRDHGFGVNRLPMETNYFEAYNRDNVRLISLVDDPIRRLTRTGIQTESEHHEFDIIIYATGFDGMSGAFDRLDISGVGGVRLRDEWADGPRTFMGAMVHGFPNLLMLAGPQGVAAGGNFPRGIESNVNWITDLLEYMWKRSLTRVEPTETSQARWVDHVKQMFEKVLMRKAKGWITGYNENIDGRAESPARYFTYNGGGPKFRKIVRELAESGYEGMELS